MLMVPHVIGKTQREYIISLSSYVDSVIDTTEWLMFHVGGVSLLFRHMYGDVT